MEHPERECVTCGEKGHWYTDCPKVPFNLLMGAAFSVTTPEQTAEIRDGIRELQSDPKSAFFKK